MEGSQEGVVTPGGQIFLTNLRATSNLVEFPVDVSDCTLRIDLLTGWEPNMLQNALHAARRSSVLSATWYVSAACSTNLRLASLLIE